MQTSTLPASRVGLAQTIDELDLGALGRGLWRRKRLILGWTLLAAAVAFLAVNFATPRYKSEARVLIETRDNIFLRPEADRTPERMATVDQEAVTSQVQLILSRGLALDVIRRLKLGEKPEFDPVLRGTSLIRSVLGVVGIARDPMSQTPEERVLRSYMERIAAFQVEKSRVIAIEFESQDSELASQVVNAIAEGYLVLQQAAKREQNRAAGEWLAGEIEKLRHSVAEAEVKVENYRSTTNLMIGTNNTTLSGQQLGDINARLASARAEKSDAESKARVIRDALQRGTGVAEFSDILNSEVLRRLNEQRVTLRAQLAEQSSTLLARHPRIKELSAQISDLERQMRFEAERLARAFENDAKLASGRMEDLSVSLNQLKSQAAASSGQDVKLRELEREAKSQRDLLESYLAKYRETTARDNIGAASPDARVISRGIISSTPSWPKKAPIVLVAALGMFTLVTGFLLTGLLMGNPIGASAAPAVEPAAATAAVNVTPPELARRVPAVSARSVLVPTSAATSPPPAPPPAADARPPAQPPAPSVRSAPTLESQRVGVPIDAIEGLALALGTAGDSGRRIAVVGARRNMGTTLAAISLARALARQGRAILVDLALESPNLSVITNDTSAPGLSELVMGSASFGQIITRDRHSRVHVIAAGNLEAGSSTILSSQRLMVTLEALNRSYDYVVLDAGALPDIAAEQFARLAPRAVLVADDIDGPTTESARERLLSAGFPNVSVLASTPQGPESDAGGTQAAA